MQTLLDDYRWLVSPDGDRWLKRVAGDDRDPLALATALRRELSSQRTHLVLEQTELRRRAARKFSDADRMFFTRVGLEQATDQVVAAYKADRFPAKRRHADLCCGVGGDLAALSARGPTLGVDRNRVVALLAAENLDRLGHGHSQVVVADATDVALDADTAWHLDPDRREEGRRSTQLCFHSPDRAAVERLLDRVPHAALKLAPATDVPDGWAELAELEWISRNRQCRQQVAWFGNLARTPTHRRATVVLGRDLDASVEVRTLVGRRALPVPVAENIGRYVFEPDPAVLAADLTGALASQHAMEGTASSGVYLTADRPVSDAAMSRFEVDEVVPFDKKRLKRHLAARGLGRLEIKTRGLPHDPDLLRRQLRVPGDTAGVLILCRRGDGVVAVLARRV